MEENLKHKTKVGLYWKLAEQVMTYGMSFVIGIVMARLLTPEDYGITALPAVFLAVASIFINGSFSQALVRKPELTEKDLSTSFYYSIMMGVFMYACMFFAAPYIANFYDTPILTPLIRITALNFLWGPLSTPQSVILNRRLDFKIQSRINVINQFIGGVVGIISAYIGFGLWALVISSLVSSLMGLIQRWWAVKWLPKAGFSKESFKYLWNYGSKMMGVSISDILYNNITPIFIGKYYSPKDLGVYNKALSYAGMFPSTITGVIASVSFPVLSKFQSDDNVLAVNYRRMIKAACFVTFPLMLLLAALAKPLVVLLITEKWLACVPYLQIMCFWKMLTPLSALNLNLLQVKGNTGKYLKLEMIKKTHGLLIMLITLPMGIIPFLIGTVINSSICVIENTYCTGTEIGVGTFKQMRDIIPIFMISIVMAVVVYFTNLFFVQNLYLQVIVGSCLCLSIILGLSKIFKLDELEDVKYILLKRK